MRIYEKRFDLDFSAPESRPQLIELQLASGAAVRIAAIKLYDRKAVEHLAEIRMAAFALLSGEAGLLPARDDWAVTPALLVNAINRRVSPRKAQEAQELLQEAADQASALARDGRMFPVPSIRGLEHPHPHLWSYAESVFERRNRGFLGRDVAEEVRQEWIHSGEPFVTVADEGGGERNIRWSAVEQYRLITAAKN
jgi:hypothetical protein